MAALMFCGHDPREVREYEWRDIELFLAAAPVLEKRRALGGVND